MSDAHRKALETDEAWARELHRIFGKRAGEARYTFQGKGAPGTHLRALYDARKNAQTAWHAEINVQRQSMPEFSRASHYS
jgi:hypothetical protein